MKNLESIIKKYSSLKYNDDNYSVGGGLDGAKFASNRHEEANHDKGKLTIGKANAMFKIATSCAIDQVKEVINYAVPNPEWHHAGLLPKSYGGGMRKTYFLNASEIIKIAQNWDNLISEIAIKKNEQRIEAEKEKSLKELQNEFLKANAKQISRVISRPENFYETDKEMNGKYGWFSSYGKSYNMTEYYTGWQFESAVKLQEFYNIKVSAQTL